MNDSFVKNEFVFLSSDNVLMVLVAGHLVILCGFLRVNVRGSSSGSRISFNTRSFMLPKCRIFCPRSLRVNPLTLQHCFPSLVM